MESSRKMNYIFIICFIMLEITGLKENTVSFEYSWMKGGYLPSFTKDVVECGDIFVGRI